jgi:hypothetical protein
MMFGVMTLNGQSSLQVDFNMHKYRDTIDMMKKYLVNGDMNGLETLIDTFATVVDHTPKIDGEIGNLKTWIVYIDEGVVTMVYAKGPMLGAINDLDTAL